MRGSDSTDFNSTGFNSKKFNTIGYFHVCTDGRSLPWMFKDKSDYIAGVNRMAVCHLRTKAKIVAYVLMDNHVHFVLYGTMPQCKKFITLYKQLTGTWIHIKYNLDNFLKQLPTKILQLETEERILNTIAYIDRNPVVAGYKYLPTEYPWGSAQYMFRNHYANEREEKNTKTLAEFTIRAKRALLGTRFLLPDTWQINDEGMICPYSFMDISALESCFKTPVKYSYFLAKKLEGIVNQELEFSQKTFIPDIELRKILKGIIQQDYGKENISELDINKRLSVARKLRYNYAATTKQIARMVQLEKEALEGFI